ncbi:hypothetical protein TW81_03785 [Vibrio galatheae]|uniref:Response regulatory domain-containing protein n=1 Tax=Vibrio galatheae TaxID=579748 RepID=A0A0F4NP52_9VIBR|nr:response regulator [Vibrio galatheae]KJY84659.1 hypothetical protein TW81_03785 [Vibrio galatheae]
MNTLKCSELKVLVADDSRLVCSSIVLILREIGFNDITCVYRPKEVINQCKQTSFDIVICDVNFNSQINGYQLLEELKHLKLLKSDAFFVFLTGENQPQIVRTIIDSNPDDYWLKPFNKPFLSKRLTSGLKRKKSLSTIYSSIRSEDYTKAIQECDELLPFHSQYTRLIGTLKAQCLAAMKEFHSSENQYKHLIENYDNDVLKLSLYKVLIEQDKSTEAKEILNTISNKNNNPYFHDGMAAYYINKNDIENSIYHLKQATRLLEIGTDRELLISKLYLVIHDYESAFEYMKIYSDKNEYTFRNNEYNNLNYIRHFLLQFDYNINPKVFKSKLHLIDKQMNLLENCKNMNIQNTLIQAHIKLLTKDISGATGLITNLDNTEGLHYYDYFHWAFLLDELSIFKEIPTIINKAKSAIENESDLYIRKIQEIMLTNFNYYIIEKKNKINKAKSIIKNYNTDNAKKHNLYLEQYTNLKKLMPNSSKVSLAIIKFLAANKIDIENYREMFNLLTNCHHVVDAQMSEHEKNIKNYKTLYNKAKENVSAFI